MKRNMNEELVYNLPWRSDGIGGGSSGGGGGGGGGGSRGSPSPSNISNPGSAYPPQKASGYSLSRSAVGHGSSSSNVGGASVPAFSKEQYLAAGWTIDQLLVHHPELFWNFQHIKFTV